MVLRTIYNQYNFIFNQNEDPRIKALPLLGSPIPVLACLVLYLTFVKGWGLKWMEERKPFELSRIIRVYNAVQILANAVLFFWIVVDVPKVKNYRFFCVPESYIDFSTEADQIVNASYFYYMLKYFDLLDTVFFILRKKNSQVTFLHVYHHAGMVFYVYSFLKIVSGGGHGTILGLLNSTVHMMMYGYYFMASYNPSMKGLHWWKNLVTKAQLCQFALILVYFLISMFVIGCNNSAFYGWMGLVQAVTMIVMFSDFYIKAYRKRKAV